MKSTLQDHLKIHTWKKIYAFSECAAGHFAPTYEGPQRWGETLRLYIVVQIMYLLSYLHKHVNLFILERNFIIVLFVGVGTKSFVFSSNLKNHLGVDSGKNLSSN